MSVMEMANWNTTSPLRSQAPLALVWNLPLSTVIGWNADRKNAG